MVGRKPTTLPTPLNTPSMTSDCSTSFTCAAASAFATTSVSQPMPASSSSDSHAPTTLNVSQNTSAMMATNAGMAVNVPVSSLSSAMLRACSRLYPRAHHALVAHALDEGEPHVGDGRRAVQAALVLHLAHDVPQQVLLVLVEGKLLQHERVALGQLAGGEPHGDARTLGMVAHERHDAVQAAVHGAAVRVGCAEVLADGRLLVARHMQRMVHELADTLVLGGGDGHHGHAQQLLHLVHADGAAVALHLAHHVQGHHHGNAQLEQLHGQGTGCAPRSWRQRC